VGIALGEPCELGRIQAGVHAGEDGKAPSGRHRQFGFVAEIIRVTLVRGQHLVQDFGHAAAPRLLTAPMPDIDWPEILPDASRISRR
jgi:hypothetical protein